MEVLAGGLSKGVQTVSEHMEVLAGSLSKERERTRNTWKCWQGVGEGVGQYRAFERLSGSRTISGMMSGSSALRMCMTTYSVRPLAVQW